MTKGNPSTPLLRQNSGQVRINPLPVVLSEAAVKRAVEDRLQIAQNQGQLIFLRLNSGDFIETRGETRRRIKGCPPGTADYVVFQPVAYSLTYAGVGLSHHPPAIPATRVTFIECKSSTGKQSPGQIEFQEQVEKFYCRYYLVRDADELTEILR